MCLGQSYAAMLGAWWWWFVVAVNKCLVFKVGLHILLLCYHLLMYDCFCFLRQMH